MKGGLGLIPDDPSRIAPYDLRQSYMSLSWPWVRLLRVLAVFPASPEGSTPPPIKATPALPAPGVGAWWGYSISRWQSNPQRTMDACQAALAARYANWLSSRMRDRKTGLSFISISLVECQSPDPQGFGIATRENGSPTYPPKGSGCATGPRFADLYQCRFHATSNPHPRQSRSSAFLFFDGTPSTPSHAGSARLLSSW